LTSPNFFFKQLTDVFLSLAAIIAFLPLILIIALAIKIDSPGPVLFRQRRIGKHGNCFEILKFRTMLEGTPDLPTDQMLKLPSRVTRMGKLLRSTSLDELPQLLNVLKGDMSLVGPRPALYNQTELTTKREALGVLRFLPGITGWAQINGRDDLPDDTKVKLDQWYCDNWHYWLDWQIMFSTLRYAASGKGAY
jgi:O-antigen biosynthesis protein WbqP